MGQEVLIAELLGMLPDGSVITDPAELFVYESDGFTIAHARPAAVVFPTSTEHVAGVIKALVRHGGGGVAGGWGRGLGGGCVAYDLGVVVSTARMNRILAIDLENRVAHVEAGVRNLALSDAVAALPLEVGRASGVGSDPTPQTSPARDPEGARAGQLNGRGLRVTPNPYHFSPDPSSQRASTIGGNASTNAGG